MIIPPYGYLPARTSDATVTELYQAVGECLAKWSWVEYQMLRLFCISLDIDDHRWSSVYNAVIAFEARLQMTTRAIESVKDEALAESWNAVANKLTRLYRKRHEVAHFSVFVGRESGKAFLFPFYIPAVGDHDHLAAGDLLVRAASFERAAVRVSRLCSYLLQGSRPENPAPARDRANLLQNPKRPER